MRNMLRGSVLLTLLLLCLLQISLNFAPFALGETISGRKDFWQVVNVTNTQPYNTVMDLNVTVNSRNGVNIACSNNVTAYYQNLTYWQGRGYMTYFDWLNGTSTLTYNWGQMDWYVSNGSLTPISYSAIQFWGDMYLDSGGGVNYTTFMGNTFMADWNLSDPNNSPDIISQANWQGNQIKMISGLMVPNSTTINVVFDIVMTQTGSYTFNITTTPGVTVTPSTWTVGGASTILVPNDLGASTIHGAISSANPGDTIVVAAGIYNESQILIDKPLRLIGSGAGTSIIDGQLVAPPTVGLVRITSGTGDVTFSGFTVKNAGKTSGTRAAIYAQSASSGVTYTISSNAIYGTNDPNDDQDYGIYAYQGNESLLFINNSITQTGANPILIEQHLGPVEISYNTLDVGVYGSDAIFCMTYGGYNITSLQKIRNNTINMGTGGPFDIDHRATGITFASAYNSAGNGTFTNIVITGNTIFSLTSYRRGIQLWNSATGDGTGGNIATASITGNTINGTGAFESYGIRLLGLVSNGSITGNNITNNAYGIYMDNATGASVTNNDIFGNYLFGIDNTGLQPLSAKYNWWGNETGPHISTSQYPNSPGDNVSDNVIFGPWLIKPYPPAVPISVTYVDPPIVALTAPALGTVFTANVTIGNVTMMYGYQYVLQWDSSLLNLLQVTDRIPTVWGTNYFITQKTQKPGNYSFAVAARAPAPPFNGSTAVASFTFKTTYDPIYPNNASCLLALTSVTIGNPTSGTILSVVLSGNYSINSVRSKLLFMASPYVATHVPKEFDATINATSVVNLGGFDFTCYFNTTLLNVMYLNVSSSLGGLPVVVQGWDNNVGYFHLNVTGIAPANGTVILATAHFKVAQGFVWSTLAPTVNCSLFFASSTFVNQTGGSIDHDAINGTYVYKPLQGDLSMDGTVDIVDLVMVAQGFGLSIGNPQYALYINADINRDGTIDILDIIYVAHNFGSSTGS